MTDKTKSIQKADENSKKAVLFIGLLILFAAIVQAAILANLMFEIAELGSSAKESYRLKWDIPSRLVGFFVTMFTAAFVLLHDKARHPRVLILFVLTSISFATLVFFSEYWLQKQVHQSIRKQGMELCEESHQGAGKYRRKVFLYSTRCPVPK